MLLLNKFLLWQFYVLQLHKISDRMWPYIQPSLYNGEPNINVPIFVSKKQIRVVVWLQGAARETGHSYAILMGNHLSNRPIERPKRQKECNRLISVRRYVSLDTALRQINAVKRVIKYFLKTHFNTILFSHLHQKHTNFLSSFEVLLLKYCMKNSPAINSTCRTRIIFLYLLTRSIFGE
jgi:hypothetical protein